jgi:hypothetical protein
MRIVLTMARKDIVNYLKKSLDNTSEKSYFSECHHVEIDQPVSIDWYFRGK